MSSDDGERLLVPIEVEAVEGWDPSLPLPSGEKRDWQSTEDLVAALNPTLVADRHTEK
jgi:hypothetical protein